MIHGTRSTLGRPRHRGFIETFLVALAAILAVTFVCATGIIDAHRELHMDEAVYSYEAIHMARSHRFLGRHTFYGVVKPPLHLLLTAISYVVFPISKVTLWLPNILLSIVGAVLLYHFVNKVAGRYAALLGLGVLLCTWTWHFYAVSAFTDVGLAVAMLGVGLAMAHGNPGWAGVAAGLAIGFKQHGVCAAALVLAFYGVESFRSSKRETRWLPLRSAALGLGRVLLPILVWTLLNGNWRMVWLREVGTAAHFSLAASMGRIQFWFKTLLVYMEWSAVLVLVGLVGLTLVARPYRRCVAWLLAFCLGYLGLLSFSSAREVQRYVLLVTPLLLALVTIGAWNLLAWGINRAGFKKYQQSAAMIMVALIAFLKVERLPVDGLRSPEWIKYGLESSLKVIAARPKKEIVLIPEDLGYEYAAEAIKRVPPKSDLYIHLFQDVSVLITEEVKLGRRGPFTLLVSRHSLHSWDSFVRWKDVARPTLTLLYARHQNGVLFDAIYEAHLR